MKGEKTINLNGEEIKLRFTVGALEDFQEHLKEVGFESSFEEALQEMKHLRVFLEKLSEFAGNKVQADKWKYLDFSEMSKAIQILTESTSDLDVPGKPGKGRKK